ncbi:MAG TPA: TIGR02680 family protein [Solirubrobacteraceae bacterium]|nr:TIGR02680 family protein [Solirubrobacteraceae bacterium]
MTGVDRFRLVRAGILNLYEYGDQVFELAGGRLLLRGHNTSGKTKALELLLPFALDGDISPRKLDPFAKAAKDMRWNLVGCIEGDQRTGYVWLEFERLSLDGTERVTGVIGMKANANLQGVKRWYAVVRDRRIGDDLMLRRGEVPLSKAELAAELGDECPLIATPSEYRRTMNDAVFGFPSEDAYQTMLTLMLELRRPHLSKALDPAGVTRLLSASLPEVDHDLIRRLGDALEQLEEMRRSLERLRRAHRRLTRFVADSYSAYARAVLHERGDALRRGETAYENAARRHRQALDGATEARGETERIAVELAAAQQAAERAEGALTALLQSPEWQSVEAVEQLARRAERQTEAARAARGHADHAAVETVIGEAQEARSGSDLADAEGERESLRDHLRRCATDSGFGPRHAVLDDQLGAGDPELWRELAVQEVKAWRGVLAEQEQLLAEIDRADRGLEQAKAVEEAQELRLRGARKRQSEARGALEAEQEHLAERIDRWVSELRELPVPDLAVVLAATLEAGRPGAAEPSTHWRAAADDRRRELARTHAGLETRHASLEERLDELTSAIKELDAEIDSGPKPLVTRPASRDSRPGLALWQAIDYAPELDSTAQAGLEAALEAAGLLDAWVMPDGALLDGETLDAVLVDGVRQEGPTLADALRLAPEAPQSLRTTLGAIALADDAPTAGGIAVDLRGGFALGPLRGRYAKPQAEFIGARARAAARVRRRAALVAEREQVVRERSANLGSMAALDARAQRLTDEEAAFPSTDAVANANRELLLAEQHADQLAREQAEAAAAVRRAGQRVEHARGVSQEHAEQAGLPSLLNVAELRARAEAASRYQDGLGHAVEAVRRIETLATRASEDRERLAGLRAHAEQLEQAAQAEATEARRLASEHAEREAALSADAATLRRRRQTVDEQLRSARTNVVRLQADDKEATGILAAAVERAQNASEREAEARSHREAALNAFARMERSDIFRLALDEDAPADHHNAADWSLTRALEVLRGIPDSRLVSDPSDKLAASLSRACSELDRDIAQEGDMSVFTTVDSDGALTVRVRDGAAERPLPELTSRLAAEIADRDRTLTAEQRRVFGEALLEEIASHLRARIHEVRTRVDEMNGVLRHSGTAAGKVVQLAWRPRSETDATSVIPLIGKPASGLGDAERDALVGFFRSRIELAQSAEIDAGDGESTVQTLRDAFDYRKWFTFELWEGIGRERQALTAARHALGSGGEQAVLIHLPLFAAAAALYDGARSGPRLVMLDEALSGIDDDTRERVMGALVDLDLDFVMTSHELWGTYHTVPSLAIYQLYREQGLFGVHCERFVWDGSLLREEEQGDLFRA